MITCRSLPVSSKRVIRSNGDVPPRLDRPECGRARSAGGLPVRLSIAAVLALAIVTQAAEAPRAVVDPRSISLQFGDRPVARYLYKDVPFKPYIQEFRTPAGINILRDSPMDHKHHHGLMFAVAVNGVNFWEERDDSGREEHREIRDVFAGPLAGTACASFSEQLVWTSGVKRLLNETRTIRLLRDPAGKASLLCWTARLRPAEMAQASAAGQPPSVTLSGANYFGLGMRFIPSMDKTGRFINADGGKGVAGTNDKRSSWCAYLADADGKPVTVAMFDHPENTRHPATWFTMLEPFSYLCVTLGLHHKPLELSMTARNLDNHSTAVPPPPLIYGVALWDGHVAPEEINRLYRQWVSLMDDAEHIGKPPQTTSAPAR